MAAGTWRVTWSVVIVVVGIWGGVIVVVLAAGIWRLIQWVLAVVMVVDVVR